MIAAMTGGDVASTIPSDGPSSANRSPAAVEANCCPQRLILIHVTLYPREVTPTSRNQRGPKRSGKAHGA
jgi:hypothetical protein